MSKHKSRNLENAWETMSRKISALQSYRPSNLKKYGPDIPGFRILTQAEAWRGAMNPDCD